MTVAVWLFANPLARELTLHLVYPYQITHGQTVLPEPGHALLGAVRRAKAAKALLDATYPDTQPQDYGYVTWLAGTGSRLSVAPANFSAEVGALPKLLDGARKQLLEGVATRTTSSEMNKERVRNATALLMNLAPVRRQHGPA